MNQRGRIASPPGLAGPDPAIVPSLPRDADGPVFRAPWEAQAFAMAVMLHERGHFSWREWADRLAHEIAAARERGEVDDGRRYYESWLAALERLVEERGLVGGGELRARKHDWETAARETPHGQPIRLSAPRVTSQ
jgi:nitrile hydratase accessory protein